MMQQYFQRCLGVSFVVLSLSLGACGSTSEIPTAKIANVEMAIANARENEAQIYSTLELTQAEKKFEQAKEALNKEDYAKASILLDQALLDATLAEKKAQSAIAAKAKTEMQDTLEALRQETERNTK